ncbi:MAG: phosphoenolpyruvate--protein phosphotransferase [Oscillospiraceae bacterium]
MIAIKGTGVSAGIAEGELFYYKRTASVSEHRQSADSEKERERWEIASAQAAEQLDALAEKTRVEIGDEAALLFETHRMMLEDLDYTDRITALITEEKYSAEYAVETAGKEFSEMFAAMDDDYMKARSIDVTDISSRVIAILSGSTNENTLDKPVIIAADDLTPSETVQLDKSMILGFVLTGGNANSHTAILARTLGIPAVINADIDLNAGYEGRPVIMDGSVGYIVIDPDDTTREYLGKKQREEKAVRAMLEQLKGQPDITADGKEIKVYANITSPSDIDAVITNDARGIGLFRSEFLYLGSDDFPTEDVQFEAYKTVVQRMNGARVIIRTMDIGADKKISYFDLADEENPALGMRALRICLSRPEIFKTQLRALYRASAYGKLAIMFPMVSSLWEVQEAKQLCSAVMAELKKERIPFDSELELGVMIETPAAVMIAPELAKEVSFFSIGTNDLTQYTIALDRQSIQGLERFYDPKHPAVLRMIKMTVDAAHEAGIWAGICGELAADCSLTESFIKMGVDELSVSPRSVLPIRNAVRRSSLR